MYFIYVICRPSKLFSLLLVKKILIMSVHVVFTGMGGSICMWSLANCGVVQASLYVKKLTFYSKSLVWTMNFYVENRMVFDDK